MEDLPQEVVVEILLRLPVKSLLRFRSVCNAWLSLISDPNFAKSHFERCSSTGHTHRILYTVAFQAWSLDFNASLHDDSAVSKLEFPLPSSQAPVPVRIMGSCRSFVLLAFNDCVDDLIIWNPSTGSIKRIPQAPKWVDKLVVLCGFGYDASADDYLVVQASIHDWPVWEAHVPVTILETFSVKTNSWRKIEVKRLSHTYFNLSNDDEDDPVEGYLVNGSIHWLASCLNGMRGAGRAIIAFDLKEKELHEVPMPDDVNGAYCDLGVFGGLLGLIDLNSPGNVGIWVMKEYEVKSSWINLINVPLVGNYFIPICLSKGGEVVGIDGGEGLAKYSNNGELLERHEYCHDTMNFGVTASVYTESLLSLPSNHED